jgi:hypothetical protein
MQFDRQDYEFLCHVDGGHYNDEIVKQLDLLCRQTKNHSYQINIFDIHNPNWANYASQYFTEWRNPNTIKNGPALFDIVVQLCDFFQINHENKLVSVALAAAIIGDIPHHNPYHNNHHFREVVIVVCRLMALHNDIGECENLSINNILLLFIAACIHDFAHDGRGNIIEGHHIAGRCEQKSLDHAKPYLLAAGMRSQDFEKIEILIKSTDASRGKNGKSPTDIARDIFLSHEHENISIENVPIEFAPLVQDYHLSLMAMLLCEADIAMSSGFHYEFSKEMTRLIAEESSVLEPTAKTLHGFMQIICQGGYLTKAAQTLFSDNFQAILLEAEQDCANDVKYA